MGVASLSCCPPDTDSARYHLETAKDMMDKLLEACAEEEEVHTFLSPFQLLLLSPALMFVIGGRKSAIEITTVVTRARRIM